MVAKKKAAKKKRAVKRKVRVTRVPKKRVVKAVKKGVARQKKVVAEKKRRPRSYPKKLPVIRGPLLDTGKVKAGEKGEKALKRLRNELEKALKLRPGHPVFMTSLRRVEKELERKGAARRPVVSVPMHFTIRGAKKRREKKVTAAREAALETKVQQAEEAAYEQAKQGLGFTIRDRRAGSST